MVPNPAKVSGSEPIDAVYTWTGGEDLLRFSLRSLDRYAPWIRKVHLVTDGPAPAWIPADHPRLAAVRHEDLFPDRTALPTSNPEALRWQLFRIPQLSRKFLYLDEHCLLGSTLSPQDFLNAKGGYRFFVEDSEVPPAGTAAKLVNSRFGNRGARKLPARTPHLLDRDFLEEVHRLWGREIKQTTAHREPQPDDVAMEALYFYYLMECPLLHGVHEQTPVTRAVFHSLPVSDTKQVAGILFRRPKFFALDGMTRPGAVARLLLNLFYRRRSSFEVKSR